jgi:Gti1/Pac2 family transcription factor
MAAASGYPGGYGTTNSATTMQPTWHGFVHTTHDVLMILEACLSARLSHIPRRPHDRERASLIASGNVFVYEENASGIKRWTDGMTWSPSRIMGNFLVYRELNPNNYPSGEKKVARKRKRSADLGPTDGNTPTAGAPTAAEEDRRLVGSLVDSYGFKPDGLVKRTLTVQYKHVAHHLISYYTVQDVKDGILKRPEFDTNLAGLQVRSELLNYAFKQPIHDAEDMEPSITTLPRGAMVPIGARQVPYTPSFAVQPAIQNYQGLQRHSPRNLHRIQTQYPNPGFVGSQATHVGVHPHYTAHMSNASSVSVSPLAASPSPNGYIHPVTYDNALQISYVAKDQRIDSLVPPEGQRRFAYDEPWVDDSSKARRQKLDTPSPTVDPYYDHGHLMDPLPTSYAASNEMPPTKADRKVDTSGPSEPVPTAVGAYYDNSHLVDSIPTTYEAGNGMSATKASSYAFDAHHDYTTAASPASLQVNSYEHYEYGKGPTQQPASIGPGFVESYDPFSIPPGWNAGYQDLHPLTAAGLS